MPSHRHHPGLWLVAVTLVVAPGTVLGLGAAALTVQTAASGDATRASDIPADYLRLAVATSATCPGLSWTVPAAIAKVESDFGRSDAPGVASGTNGAGAAGPMQLGVSGPAGPTFFAYDHPVPADPAPTPGGQSPPSPYDAADAVYAAVRDLCTNGAGEPARLRDAIWAYNHSGPYVQRVLDLSASYSTANSGSASAMAAIVFARRQLGVPYRWGGESDQGFDCSGLVQAAYATAGIALPRVAQAQFDAGPSLPPGAALQPGDLVFFGAAATEITHVGIYLGGGQMIDAPHAGAVVRIEADEWPDLIGATRPAASA